MIDVQDDHLGGTAGLASGLDGAGRSVSATHETHRAGGSAAALQEFLGGTDAGEVDPCTGTTLEDRSFFAVPVEDGIHRVVDRQNEACARLLRHALDADVEPHRAVERCALRDEDELQLIAEGFGLVGIHEIAAIGSPVGNGVGNPGDHLAQRGLALRGTRRTAEVLLSNDIGGVQRPPNRKFNVELLEGNRTVLPVADASVPSLPHDLVIRVRTRGGEMPPNTDPELLRRNRHAVLPFVPFLTTDPPWSCRSPEASG
ncbi:unannotated protein [freshwater metagenome]|uniref:Unannotated protein n=1 Tax=freshwater metagenome TaxID=449393 RepID=A0A6J7PLK1_9ZZZZ